MPAEAPIAKSGGGQALGATVQLGGASVDECVAAAQGARGGDRHGLRPPVRRSRRRRRARARSGSSCSTTCPTSPRSSCRSAAAGCPAASRSRSSPRGRTSRSSASRPRPSPPFPASLQAGEPVDAPQALTIADGIAVKRPGELTLGLIAKWVDDVVVGSWITYGLGTENENLPGFIVFTDYRGGPINGAPNWGNRLHAGCISRHQFRDTGDPIVDLRPPVNREIEQQRKWLALLHDLNEKHWQQNTEDSELSARIDSYELAFRMQAHAPEVIDISGESEATKKLYGLHEKRTEYFGRQALMARRLVERGVRYVQIFSGGGNFEPSWDAHWE